MSSANRSDDGEHNRSRYFVCESRKDGKIHMSLATSVVLSRWKLLYCCMFGVAMLMYAFVPLTGVSGLRKRVADLERKLSKKVHWVIEHSEHIQSHLSSSSRKDYPDGKKHLLTPEGAVSKLAEALAPNTQLAAFDDHYLCGSDDVDESEVITKTIAIAAVSWRAPLSLRNSMNSWRANGLLDIVDEKMIFINSPSSEDLDIAKEFDFDIYTTEENGGNVMVGPALAYLVGNSSADYILLMEKDFVLSANRDTMMREMYTGVQHLARGVDAYRLRGKTDWPAEGMPDCCLPATPPTCPYHSNWRGAGTFGDHMNWLLIFCDSDIMEHSNGRLAHCTSEPNAPDSYCFTSGETNWSNNPVLFRREWFHEKLRAVSLKDFTANHLFEFNVMLEWLPWQPPAKVCVSMQGIFTHHEIDQ